MMDAAVSRAHMVASQILPNRVTDGRVIDAMGAVPREHFVPKALKGVAYLDEDLEIAAGRYLIEPMVLARLADAAEIGPDDAVLDVGCMTGYSSAVLACLGGAVVALEEDPVMAARASEKLAEIEADTVAVVEGQLTVGVPGQGPFDVIILCGAAEVLPDALVDQLADGGRLVYVRIEDGVGHGHLITKSDGIVGGRDLFDAGVNLLPGFQSKSAFEF